MQVKGQDIKRCIIIGFICFLYLGSCFLIGLASPEQGNASGQELEPGESVLSAPSDGINGSASNSTSPEEDGSNLNSSPIQNVTSPVDAEDKTRDLLDEPESSTDSIIITLNAENYSIKKDSDGLDVIDMDNFTSTLSPGDPMLPRRVYNILISPYSDDSTIQLSIVSNNTSTLDGVYNIKAAGPLQPQAYNYNNNTSSEEFWGEGKVIVDGRNTNIYEANADYPKDSVTIYPPSYMRKWKFVPVEFIAFKYNPVSKKLTLIENVTIKISYSHVNQTIKPSITALKDDAVLDDIAPGTFYNYNDVKDQYKPNIKSTATSSAGTYDYVIITTSQIKAGSTKLDDFISHKHGLGHSVLTVTESDFGSLTGQAPNQKAEKIRQWLKNNYLSEQIKYVLLIGNPTPYENGEGDIPMKMCWPGRNHGWLGEYLECPTDYFYSDLTGNWDKDGDSFYGEWEQDYPVAGGVDFAPEVYVGRISVYNADYTTLDKILTKIMAYESSTDASWRKSILLPMSFSAEGYDGAPLAEQMNDDYLSSNSYKLWRMYQQGSGACDVDSAYSSEEELRGGTAVRNRWASDDYGIVCWWGHGNEEEAGVGYGNCFDGLMFASSDCSSLDNNHPSFTYQCSCLNGYPEDSKNLQYSALKNGGVGTVSATRVSWFTTSQTYGQFDGSATNAGIGYEYVKRLVQGLPEGDALYQTKMNVMPDHPALMMNYFDFNIYGDPSLSIKGALITPPGKATLISPSGTISASTPTYTWNPVTGSTSYQLWIDGPSGHVFDQWYTASSVTSGSKCSVAPSKALTNGAYTWKILTKNGGGTGPWSSLMKFTVKLPTPPGKPTLISPSGTINTGTPAYTWKPVTGSTSYQLWIDRPSGHVFDQWYTASSVTSGSKCSVTPSKTLTNGPYTWRIRAKNDGGTGSWSNFMQLIVKLPPGKPTLISPTGTIGKETPTYTWNSLTDCTSYQLWIDGPSGHVFDQWYTASSVTSGSKCSVAPSKKLGNGAYTWKVRGKNDVGAGSWSNSMQFKVTLPPGKATLISPTGTISVSTPKYTWKPVTGSTSYQLWIDGPSGHVFDQWYTASSVTSGSICSVTPSKALTNGAHSWKILTKNDGGTGPWSSLMKFTVKLPTPPGKATLVSPTGTISTSTPKYTWKPVTGSTSYQLWIDGPSGHVFDQWYTASSVTSGSICSVTPSKALANGAHTWKILTKNDGGTGPWSNAMSFSVFAKKKWTFMVYLDGDNNLEKAGIADFLEMASAGSTADVNIVAQFDRVPGYSSEYGDWSSCKRFYIAKSMTPVPANALADLGESNMGDPSTLSNFLSWAKTNYPASNYALILWNHGSGWKKTMRMIPWADNTARLGDDISHNGICYDDTNGDHLTLQEAESVLAGSSVTLIGYDACLMQMIEVLHQVRPYSEIQVGSEEVVPGYGWPYNTVLGDLTASPAMTPKNFGSDIVQRYMASYAPAKTETKSAVLNSDIPNLVTAVDGLAQALINVEPGEYSHIQQASKEVDHYEDESFVDLYDFARLVKLYVPNAEVANAAQNVMDKVAVAVYSEGHGTSHANAHGVSIFLPYTQAGYLSSYESTKFAIDTHWDEFLKKHYDSVPASGFNEQFGGSSIPANWNLAYGTWNVGDGYLHSSGQEDNWHSIYYNADFSDFTYEAKISRGGDTQNSNAILVRGNPSVLCSSIYNQWDTAYYFQYARNGEYGIWKATGACSWAWIQPWTYSEAINQGDAWNTLKVGFVGGQINFYINNELVWSGTDSSLSSGKAGLSYFAGDGGDFWADYATLTTGSSVISSSRSETEVVSEEQKKLNKEAKNNNGNLPKEYCPSKRA